VNTYEASDCPQCGSADFINVDGFFDATFTSDWWFFCNSCNYEWDEQARVEDDHADSQIERQREERHGEG